MKKPLFDRIAIVGVGLIGGSIGIAVRERRLARLVVGVFRKKETIRKALGMGAVDVALMDLGEGVRDADLVILSAPVSTICAQLEAVAPYLKKGAVVIDVGSSKGTVEAAARRHLRKNRFVGCHPMAGSEKCGVEHAAESLFDGSVCFMTSPDARIAAFWRALGAIPRVISIEAHDAWVARASHLPHLLAFALFQDFKRPKNFPLNPSVLGLSRLAQSHPELWTDILLSNREAVLRAAKGFQIEFSHFTKALAKKDANSLRRLIQKGNR